jgi:hypothetical protein
MYNDTHSQGKKCSFRNEVSCIKVQKPEKTCQLCHNSVWNHLRKKCELMIFKTRKPMPLMTQFRVKSVAKIIRIDEFQKLENPRYAKIL